MTKDQKREVNTLFAAIGRVPCHFKVEDGYCAKLSARASNYCSKHTTAMKARYKP